MSYVPSLSVVCVLKHVNGDFVGDQRVEWQADRRVPESTGASGTASTMTVGYL